MNIPDETGVTQVQVYGSSTIITTPAAMFVLLLLSFSLTILTSTHSFLSCASSDVDVPNAAPPKIDRLRFMHQRGVLHRDIQLGNCVLGLEPKEKTIYMIDFGFSKFYIDPTTKKHIKSSKVKREHD